MTRLVALFLLAVILSVPAKAREAGDLARRAAVDLSEAAVLLAGADEASDRIAALTATVRAYESGIAAMRDGMREAALGERALRAKLVARDAELGSMLSLLQVVSRHVEHQSLIHPGGALETIRAGTLAATLVPSLQESASTLAFDVRELQALISLQAAGMATLEDGVAGVRDARLRLAEAIAARTDLPPRVATDDAALQALVDSAETLAGFADSLLPAENGIVFLPDRPWPLPVKGDLLRLFNEPDAAGVRRPGLIFATEARALVTAPASATIRFSGEIPGQGTVAILEPAAGSLVILAGLGQSFVDSGQIVSKDDPIGFMGGRQPEPQEKLIETARDSGLFGGETLYMEIRQGRLPIDPAGILKLGED